MVFQLASVNPTRISDMSLLGGSLSHVRAIDKCYLDQAVSFEPCVQHLPGCHTTPLQESTTCLAGSRSLVNEEFIEGEIRNWI